MSDNELIEHFDAMAQRLDKPGDKEPDTTTVFLDTFATGGKIEMAMPNMTITDDGVRVSSGSSFHMRADGTCAVDVYFFDSVTTKMIDKKHVLRLQGTSGTLEVRDQKTVVFCDSLGTASFDVCEYRKGDRVISFSFNSFLPIFTGALTPALEFRLQEMSALHDNWDDENAVPVDPQSIELARATLILLPPTTPEPEIGAVQDGRLDISWRTLFITIEEADEVRFHGTTNRDMYDVKLVGECTQERAKSLAGFISIEFIAQRGQ